MSVEAEIPTGARLAARVILIDSRDRVLFCNGMEPGSGAVFRVMPGGGLEAGETFEEAARREVMEEMCHGGQRMSWIHCQSKNARKCVDRGT